MLKLQLLHIRTGLNLSGLNCRERTCRCAESTPRAGVRLIGCVQRAFHHLLNRICTCISTTQQRHIIYSFIQSLSSILHKLSNLVRRSTPEYIFSEFHRPILLSKRSPALCLIGEPLLYLGLSSDPAKESSPRLYILA